MASNLFENQKYKDWVKSSLSLHYMKEGMVLFADKQSKDLHKEIVDSLKPNHFCFNACSTDNIKQKREQGRSIWSIRCSSNTCNRWLEKVIDRHGEYTALHCPHIAWDNTDLQKWSTHPWEVAKIYQPYGCKEQKSAKDTDSAAMLELMLKCTFFQKYLSKQVKHFSEVKAFRNTIMHNSTLEVEEADMMDHIDKMIKILTAVRDETALSQEVRESAAEAITKIEELCSKPLNLSLNKSLETIAHRERLLEIEKNIKECQKQIKQCGKDQEELTTVQKSVTELLERTSKTEIFVKQYSELDFGTKLTALTNTVLDLQTKVSKQLEDLRAEVMAQKEQVGKQEIQLMCHDSRIDNHDKEIKHIKRAIDTEETPAKKMKAEQDRQEDLKNVRNHLLHLYEEYYCKIPIYPLQSHKKEPIYNLYVQPKMKIVDSYGHRTYRDDRDRKNMYVGSYRDIFYKGSKRCRKIYVCGDAGVGKSSLCEWMVHLWCKVQANLEGQKMTDDEQVIAEFPLLFLISLRNSCVDKKHPDQDEVEKMIKMQLSLKGYDIARLLETENCLIILDGLDEWMPQEKRISTRKASKDLPVQHSVGDFTVLTTSRPWKMEVLRSELEQRIDNCINILGLGDSVDKLANNVIELLNKEYGRDKHLDDFKNEIEKNKLNHFMDVPVLLMQLVCLWHDDVEFGKSECDIYSNMITRLFQYAEKEKDLPDIDEGTNSDVLLPNCLEKKSILQQHRHLLHSLSNLAFHTLFSEKRETSLVFDHEETHIYNMTPIELEFCLKVGLLTQKVYSELKFVTKEHKSISFMHKTHHEFFTAVYLSTQTNTSEVYETYSEAVSNIDRAIEYGKVLLFVCGMNPEMATRLSEKIMEGISSDKRLEQYRIACTNKWYQVQGLTLVEELEEMMLNGLKEASDNEVPGCHLRVDDIAVIGIVDWDGQSSVSFASQIARNLDYLNVSQSKSLMVVTPRPSVPHHERDDWFRLFDKFQYLQGLEKIHIYDRGDPSTFSPEKMLDIIRPSKHTVRALVLMKIDFQKLGNHFKELFTEIDILESFSLEKCDLLHDQMEMLSKYLSKATKLKHFKLNRVCCTTHLGSEDCPFSLDLSKCRLEQLYLGSVFLKDLQVCTHGLIRCELTILSNEEKTVDILESLAAAKLLQIFVFKGKKMEMGKVLSRVIPTLVGIQYLTLRDIDFGKHVVKFSASMINLKQFKLMDGCLTDTCLRNIVDSLPAQSLDVHLQDIEILDKPNWKEQNALKYIRECPRFVVTFEQKDDWLSESTTSSMFFFTKE